jgi:hypothetical protein
MTDLGSNAVSATMINMEGFAFPSEIPIDAAHTLEQLTNRFKAVRDGLPEIVKNSKDQYSRLGISDRSDRQILIIADTTRRNLGVIDFAGARASDFKGWTTWSSRTEQPIGQNTDIEAGHGNGGKAFMARGTKNTSYMESCFEGLRTRMGFSNEKSKDRFKPGYAREGSIILNNVVETEPRSKLDQILSDLGVKYDDLPPAARMIFEKRNSFTAVVLCPVAEWEGRQTRKVKRLAEDALPATISSHGQASLTIETCEVWILVDGKLHTLQPVTSIAIPPYQGFEEPIVIGVPDILPDPETGEPIDIIANNAGPKFLKLQTSARQLQMSDETRARNVIRIWNARNNVANWPLHAIGVMIPSISFIYGELRCPSLVGDHLAGAERINLNDTPLVRALQKWTQEQVEDLADRLHRAMMAENRPRDREHARVALQGIRKLMRRFLDPDASGDNTEDEEASENGKGDKGTGRRPHRERPEYGERLDEIELEPGLDTIAIANGTRVPLRIRGLERQSDGSTKPVKAVDLVLVCSPPGLCSLGGGRLIGGAAGQGQVWLETANGQIKSNEVAIDIVDVTDVAIGAVPDETLLQGQRAKLQFTFLTNSGPRDDLLIEGSIDEPGFGLLGRHGRFTAGYQEGQATIRVRYGSAPMNQKTATIKIGSERIPQPEETGGQGSDIPEILLCGTAAPGHEEYPEAQRTMSGGEEYPTIIEDPLFNNVVWINPSSKEAMRVRRSRGGPTGVGSIASKNFMHFVALKCFDILKRLHVRQSLKGRTVSEYEFIQLAAFAEIDCADFIDAAWEMSDELTGREDSSVE